MGNVKVLDCTLRDGGYVNNWEFGENNIQNICEKLEQTNVDIIELGFMRDVNYDPNKSLFRTIEQTNHVIRSQKENIIYSALVEMANPYPLELLEQKKEGGVELLRYSFWKRCIDEAYEYASKIREKGYLNIFTPFAELYHYESKTRGMEEGEKLRRYERECEHFRERWKAQLDAGDPYYNPNFSLDYSDFTLRF